MPTVTDIFVKRKGVETDSPANPNNGRSGKRKTSVRESISQSFFLFTLFLGGFGKEIISYFLLFSSSKQK